MAFQPLVSVCVRISSHSILEVMQLSSFLYELLDVFPYASVDLRRCAWTGLRFESYLRFLSLTSEKIRKIICTIGLRLLCKPCGRSPDAAPVNRSIVSLQATWRRWVVLLTKLIRQIIQLGSYCSRLVPFEGLNRWAEVLPGMYLFESIGQQCRVGLVNAQWVGLVTAILRQLKIRNESKVAIVVGGECEE
eukprot:g60508.t1